MSGSICIVFWSPWESFFWFLCLGNKFKNRWIFGVETDLDKWICRGESTTDLGLITFRLLSDILFGAVRPSYFVHRTHGAHCSSPPPRRCVWYSLCPPVDPKSGVQQGVLRFNQVILSAFHDMMNLVWKRIRLQGRVIGVWIMNRSSFGSTQTTQKRNHILWRRKCCLQMSVGIPG